MTSPERDQSDRGTPSAHLPPPPLPPPPPPFPPVRRASPAGRSGVFLGAGALGCAYVVFSLWQSTVQDSSRNENEIPMEAPFAWLAGLASVGLAVLAIGVGLTVLLRPSAGSRRQAAVGIAMGVLGACISAGFIFSS